MRIKPQSQGVASLAEQLQAAMDQKGKRLGENTPEAAALKILGESLRSVLTAPAEPEKPDGRKRSALRGWMRDAKLGATAVFFDYSGSALLLAANALNKKVQLTSASAVFGKMTDLQIKSGGFLVTVIEDENGRRLEDFGADTDDGAGDDPDGVQEGGAESAP